MFYNNWSIVIIILLIIFEPFINFLLGYFTGWLIENTFGLTLCNGLQMLGISITPNSLPLFCGTLGVIGSFFKTSNYNNKKNN